MVTVYTVDSVDCESVVNAWSEIRVNGGDSWVGGLQSHQEAVSVI